MPPLNGRSGAQVAEDHVQALVRVLAEFEGKPLPRIHGELNRTALAKLCGFDRKVFHTNPRCAALVKAAELADRRQQLDALDQAGQAREDKTRIDRRTHDLEAQNLRLMTENAALKDDLERLRRIERLMTTTGRIP